MADTRRDIIVIGASAGGVQALQRFVGALPADFPAAIFIVLHVPAGAKSLLPQILGRAGQLPVEEATHEAPIRRGQIYTAPPDLHLIVERDRMLTVLGPRENRARPAINPLFRSAATAFGHRVIGVVLSGTLDDGAAGLWAIKQYGGLAMVQSDAVFDQMPRSAVENVAVDHHVPLDEIPHLLKRLVREPVERPALELAPPPVISLSDEGARMKESGFELDDIGRRSVFTCPECSGALWEFSEGVLEYRCHVGHAYSAESLREAQHGVVEAALWSALRALKESAALDERLAESARRHNLERAAALHRQSASAKLEQVAHLQQFLARIHPEKSA